MKVIKIHKTFSSGFINHYLVISEGENNESYINELVENWCENDPAGMNNGYSFKWEYVEDLNVIKDVLIKRLAVVTDKIDSLNYEKELLEEEMYKINNNL